MGFFCARARASEIALPQIPALSQRILFIKTRFFKAAFAWLFRAVA
jgi:hypothetical protein